MDTTASEASYSISLRLRRTTVEYAYVNVPVAGDVVKPDAQGVGRIDVEEMTRRAVEMGQRPELIWYQEEQRIEPHPIQKAPEGSERRFPF